MYLKFFKIFLVFTDKTIKNSNKKPSTSYYDKFSNSKADFGAPISRLTVNLAFKMSPILGQDMSSVPYFMMILSKIENFLNTVSSNLLKPHNSNRFLTVALFDLIGRFQSSKSLSRIFDLIFDLNLISFEVRFRFFENLRPIFKCKKFAFRLLNLRTFVPFLKLRSHYL